MSQAPNEKRATLSRRSLLDQQALAMIQVYDSHLKKIPLKKTAHSEAAKATIAHYCKICATDVGTADAVMVLQLRILRSGEGLAPKSVWPPGLASQAQSFFEKYPSVTVH